MMCYYLNVQFQGQKIKNWMNLESKKWLWIGKANKRPKGRQHKLKLRTADYGNTRMKKKERGGKLEKWKSFFWDRLYGEGT